MENPRVRLGELLVRAGLITGRQLDEALAEQQRVGKRLGSLLVETGLVSETQVTQILSQQLSVPWVSLHHIDFSRELLDLVPVDAVERFCLIPIYVRRVRGLGDALYVAMDDPTNTQALAEVAERSGLHVRAMIAPPSDIRGAIRAYYGIGEAPPVEPMSTSGEKDSEADVATGVVSRSEVEERAAHAANGVPIAEAQPAAVKRPSEARAGAEDLRSMAPAKRPAAVAVGGAEPAMATAGGVKSEGSQAEPPVATRNASSSSQAKAVGVSSSAGSGRDATGAREAPPSSGRVTAQQGAERSSRAVGESIRADAARRRMVSLTLLDGTTIRLPSKGGEQPEEVKAPAEHELTARDLVSALRAAARGADASEVLGSDARWERLFAALLSLLLKKHLIADWEFVEELTKG